MATFFTSSCFALVVLAALAGTPGAASSVYWASVKDYDALRACLLSSAVPSSHITSRDDPLDAERYLDLNWQYNTLYGIIAPLAYVQARHAQDVSAAVRCGTQLGVRVVAKGGGHSYLKYGFGDAGSLIIDTGLLNYVNVTVDGAGQGLATIGAGTRQGKILAELWAAGGWLLPVGGCPTVGIAGYLLGGGYGFYSRWLGLGADHVLELKMVDATGAIRTVNAFTNPDLFWALRGGGGGNFGIVTEAKLRLRRAPDHVHAVQMGWSWDQFPDWFRSWQRYVYASPPANIAVVPLFIADYIGMLIHSMNGTRDEVEEVIARFPPAHAVSFSTFAFPDFAVHRASEYWPTDAPEPLTHISQLVNLTRHNAVGWKRVKSIFVDRPLVADTEIAALEAMFRAYVGAGSEMFFEQFGGAISDVGSTDTAFVHRGPTVYGMQLQAFSPDGVEPVDQVQAIEAFFEGSKAIWNHTASYQNYLDQELPDYLDRYYGANLERLVAVKARVDLDNVFHHPKSIPVTIP